MSGGVPVLEKAPDFEMNALILRAFDLKMVCLSCHFANVQ